MSDTSRVCRVTSDVVRGRAQFVYGYRKLRNFIFFTDTEGGKHKNIKTRGSGLIPPVLCMFSNKRTLSVAVFKVWKLCF